MACFAVPALEAAITSIAVKAVEKYEIKNPAAASIVSSSKLKWLSRMLWGGSALLMFEHVWHGEIVPWYPFVTAMASEADKVQMLHEMSTAGIGMAALVTITWIGMLAASRSIEQRSSSVLAEEKA